MQNSGRGARLLEERSRLGLTQPQLADVGGVSKGSQILYEKGSAPTADYLSAIASQGVDIAYILTGERSAPPVDRSMLGVSMLEFAQVHYWRLDDDAPLQQVGEVAFLSSWLRERTYSPGQCYLFRVTSDRMEPTIPAGAVVLFDHSQKVPRDNALFLLHLDDGLHVRRLRQIGRKWQAECDNRTYSDRPVLGKEDRDRIKGQVLWQSSILSGRDQ